MLVVCASVLWVAPAGAGPGGTTTATTSTTRHTTVTEQTVEAEEHQTRVTAVLDGVVVFDQTVNAAPGSPEVHALEAQAVAAVTGPGCAITGQGATGSRGSTGSTVTDQVTHTETSVTSTTTFGPGTILIGEDQSQTFFVADGTANVNTNTHTETFVTRTTTTTYLNTQHRQTTGTCAPPLIPPPPLPVLCAGREVTVDLARGHSPTAGADVIRGTPNADVIGALSGDDLICGLGGDDTINAGQGLDRVFAGAGNDTVRTGSGGGQVGGGEGDDTITGGTGNDALRGRAGNDLSSAKPGTTPSTAVSATTPVAAAPAWTPPRRVRRSSGCRSRSPDAPSTNLSGRNSSSGRGFPAKRGISWSTQDGHRRAGPLLAIRRQSRRVMANEQVLLRGPLQHRGGDAWRLKVYGGRSPDGRRRYLERTVRGSRREAERDLARLVVEADEGRHAEVAPMTFGELLDRWLEVKRASGATDDRELRVGSGEVPAAAAGRSEAGGAAHDGLDAVSLGIT